MKTNILLLVFSVLTFNVSAQRPMRLWLPLDGNVGDSSGKQNSVIKKSGVSYGSDRFGKLNTTCLFTGNSQNSYITVSNSQSTDLSSFKNITISLWFKITNIVASYPYRCLFIATNSSDSNMAII